MSPSEYRKDGGEEGDKPAAEAEAVAVDAGVGGDALAPYAPSTDADNDKDDKNDNDEDAPLPPTVLLRLRGLPFGAQEQDIRSFFEEINVVAAYICRRAGPNCF